MAAAGAFTFGFIFVLPSVAAGVLSYRLFQRISSLLQLLTFFVFSGEPASTSVSALVRVSGIIPRTECNVLCCVWPLAAEIVSA